MVTTRVVPLRYRAAAGFTGFDSGSFEKRGAGTAFPGFE